MQTVEVINQEPYKGQLNDCFIVDPMCFSAMPKLKFFRISNVHFPKGLKYLSNDLRILEWFECSLKSLPSMFEPRHIYELEMRSSQLRVLWKKDSDLPNLRSINLSFSKNLTQIPDLTSATNLEKLNLEGCINLTRLHTSVLLQKRLRYFNLKGCTCLKSLGISSMEMEALEALLLSGCSKLESIPELGKSMKRLEHLYVDGTRIKKLPENLGEMCNLRNLDANGTFIEELPSSIYRCKKLRLLHVNRCKLSFNAGCFLKPIPDTLSSGLKEVDLSYCNLSMVPDGIGLLCQLTALDLSGNEFVALPASIDQLSKLRMLCLNNCKKLESFPKLSYTAFKEVDDDMDNCDRSRFSYHVSAKGVDVSKFHASGYHSCPIISCLNCPKLGVNKNSILNSHLKLWTEWWMVPEAVFEIVGAGSEIPSEFVQLGSEGLILEGPWIGVAICAVISVHHVDGCMEGNHMVTAHIHLGEEHWKIPAPVNFMVAESETQLVLYWTKDNDLRRIVGSVQKSNFGVSFSVQPDGNIHITKIGVHFIRKEYIMREKKYDLESVIGFCSNICRFYVNACEDDMNLHHHVCKIIDFISDRRQLGFLDAIYQITKGLLRTNKKIFGVVSKYRKWKDTKYIYYYHVISLGASVLYKDFVRSLKNINDGWSSVKLELEQIVVKSRAESYTYQELLQQLNDLEATASIRFSDKFVTMFLSICCRTFDFLDDFRSHAIYGKSTRLKKKAKQIKVLAKKTSITIAAVFCMMAMYSSAFGHVKEMRDTCLTSIWEPLLSIYNSKREYFREGGQFKREFLIADFDYNRSFLKELMDKMGQSSCFTEENEKEMMSVIDKLGKNIHKVSNTIKKMSSHADQYACALGKAKKHVTSFSTLSKHDNLVSMLPLFD